MARWFGIAGFALVLSALLGGDSGAPVLSWPGGPGPDGEPLLMRMHGHFNAIRAIHRALIVGDMAGARRHARSLAQVSTDSDLVGGEIRVERIRSTARRLASARSAAAARSLATALATQCADCHGDSADGSRFVWGPQPSEDGSAAGRMARHQWAAEAIWMGLVGPSDERWREGMDALGEPPLPADALSRDRDRRAAIDDLARRLAAQASEARALRSARDKAAALAEMLGTCADCHQLARR
jgi:cytochrome c553